MLRTKDRIEGRDSGCAKVARVGVQVLLSDWKSTGRAGQG